MGKEFKTLKDEELLKFIDLHRNEVLSVIYDRYEKLIYYKVKSIVKSQQEATDLTHDIFITIFTKLHQFKGRSKFSLWIHSITFNSAIKHLKKINRYDTFENIELQDEDFIAVDSKEEKELLEYSLTQLESALGKLKPDQRLLIHMKYTDGMSIKEICELTGLKESNAKMKLKRIRDKLLEYLNES